MIMLLRSGIILPFQFREHKKLLMVGGPEENRDLSLWDLRNVVRATFGINNFEFRNKKIDFNIPDDLLLNYLAQRHDLTNFVIEIRLDEAQTIETATSANNKEIITTTTGTRKINSSNSDNSCGSPALNYEITTKLKNNDDVAASCNNNSSRSSSINNNKNNSNNSSTNQEAAKKLRISTNDNESIMPVMPKIENSNAIKSNKKNNNFNQNNVLQQQITTVQHNHHHQQPPLPQQQQLQHYNHNHVQSTLASNLFSSYNPTASLQPPPPPTPQQQQHPLYISPNSIFFRRE